MGEVIHFRGRGQPSANRALVDESDAVDCSPHAAAVRGERVAARVVPLRPLSVQPAPVAGDDVDWPCDVEGPYFS